MQNKVDYKQIEKFLLLIHYQVLQGSATAPHKETLTHTKVGIRCPGSLLKKSRKVKPKIQTSSFSTLATGIEIFSFETYVVVF